MAGAGTVVKRAIAALTGADERRRVELRQQWEEMSIARSAELQRRRDEIAEVAAEYDRLGRRLGQLRQGLTGYLLSSQRPVDALIGELERVPCPALDRFIAELQTAAESARQRLNGEYAGGVSSPLKASELRIRGDAALAALRQARPLRTAGLSDAEMAARIAGIRQEMEATIARETREAAIRHDPAAFLIAQAAQS